MPLFETLPVDRAAIASLVASHWGLSLGDCLKASQNHTFAATAAATAERFAVRVTPDPKGEQGGRIEDELRFVRFVAERVPGVCSPVLPKPAAPGDTGAVRAAALVVCVFTWAQGEPLDFGAYRWMTDAAVVTACGAWLARLHAASREFATAHRDVAARMRNWSDLHGGLMQPVRVAPADLAVVGDPAHYGVLHSDLNVSNFYLIDAPSTPPRLSVFDFDQTCRGWFEYDLSAPLLTPHMLAEGGSLPAGDPVPQADPAAVETALVAGYESVAGAGAVDRARLARMLALRKRFYARFCDQAAAEGGTPPDMAWFLAYVRRWLARAPLAAENEVGA